MVSIGTYISAVLTPDREKVRVFSRDSEGRRRITDFDAPYYFFLENKDGDYQDIFGTRLEKVECHSPEEFHTTTSAYKNAGIKMWESDIRPEYKVLGEHFYGKKAGKLNITFFDIEVDYDKTIGFSDPANPYAPVSAISYYHVHSDRTVVYVVPPKGISFNENDIPSDLTEDGSEIVICQNEKQVLMAFLREIEDSDIISGWNSEGFDVPYLYERIKLILGESAADKLSFDKARKPRYKQVKDKFDLEKNVLVISGRVHLDLMQLFKKFDPGERDSDSLDSVAEDVLGIKKVAYEGSLADLYNNDFITFLRYNKQDSVLLKGLEKARGYIQLAIMLTHMDACQMDDINGTVKLTETAIINHCIRELGLRIPDTKEPSHADGKYKGADVLSPMMGMHKMLASIDVQSLYPSAMRALNISPETIVGQFRGGPQDFARIKTADPHTSIILEHESGKTEIATAAEWRDKLSGAGWAVSGYGTVFDQSEMGIIPTLLTTWFSQRKQYKAKAEEFEKLYETETDPVKKREYKEQHEYYDKIQLVVKLKLNSTYGACGNIYFKFYDVRLAESTTRSGVEVLYHMAKSIGLVLGGEYTYPNPFVIYGDTDSNYFLTTAKTVDGALAVANMITDHINDSFEEFSKNTFLCVGEHAKTFLVTQEVVADYGIFINGKKNYMLHLCYKDGIPVDKVKITGLAIKKTTVPKVARDVLKKTMEKVVRGAAWSDVSTRFLEFKEEVLSGGVDVYDVGLPKNVSKVEAYSEAFFADETTRLPGHVAAAIFYNQCLDAYNDKESFTIKSGMKIKVFYLKKKFGRFGSIAIPVDLNKVPDWFRMHFEPLIDREAQAVRVIDKPLASILEAINEKIPTRQSLLIEEGFEF